MRLKRVEMIGRAVFRNFGWKLLSLAIALVVWFLVASEPELSTFASVPVQYRNLPPELEISSDIVESIYVELRGPAGELRSYDSRAYSVVLDMSNVRPGAQTFSINSSNVRLPRGLRLVRSIPSQLRFEFERSVTREVPVEVKFTGKPEKGYALEGFTVNPNTLRVAGPESRVAKVKSVETDPVDLRSLIGPAQFHVNAFVNDPHVRFDSRPEVTVDVTVISSR